MDYRYPYRPFLLSYLLGFGPGSHYMSWDGGRHVCFDASRLDTRVVCRNGPLVGKIAADPNGDHRADIWFYSVPRRRWQVLDVSLRDLWNNGFQLIPLWRALVPGAEETKPRTAEPRDVIEYIKTSTALALLRSPGQSEVLLSRLGLMDHALLADEFATIFPKERKTLKQIAAEMRCAARWLPVLASADAQSLARAIKQGTVTDASFAAAALETLKELDPEKAAEIKAILGAPDSSSEGGR